MIDKAAVVLCFAALILAFYALAEWVRGRSWRAFVAAVAAEILVVVAALLGTMWLMSA